MKEQLKQWMLATACMLFVFAAMAQQKKTLPRWLPNEGYWVTESNVHTPRKHLVRFYNNEHVLIYSEKIIGKRLNINKPKVKMKLKEALELSMTAWKKNKYAEADKDYLAVLLK